MVKIALVSCGTEYSGIQKEIEKAANKFGAEIILPEIDLDYIDEAYEKFGFSVCPDSKEERHDIIQAVTFGKPEGVIEFCKGVQAAAPVDSFVTPEPWDMPGYDSQVIMAAGAFVSGSSIELSADGPIKEPYSVFFQGGLTWPHAKIGILKTLQNLVDAGLILC